ncbi:MAG TPA: peptide deformylase [Gemmatimonadaceae bacterium]|jgi:peptide deformylase|nr:peptide deformylase [Gemmatimonadaceae bacterium]
MALLEIRVLGDPILREETIPVTEFTPELQALIDDMFETMHAAKGIGLAAPQVGRRERLTVIEIEGERVVLINPEIVEKSGKVKTEEGCLSIPDIYADVERAGRVTVRALDRDGQPREYAADGLMAVCMQHEIDHLFGTLFIDYLSVLKRRSALNKWMKEKEKYPGFIRRLSAEEIAEHHHRDEEL